MSFVKGAFCENCNLEFSSDYKSLSCAFCSKSYHADRRNNCAKISEMEMKIFDNENSQMVFK